MGSLFCQIGIDGFGRPFAGAHGRNDRSGARDDIAAGKDARNARRPVFRSDDVAFPVDFQVGCRIGNQRIGSLSDGHDDFVYRQDMIRAFEDMGGTAAAGVRLSQFHFDAFQAVTQPLSLPRMRTGLFST